MTSSEQLEAYDRLVDAVLKRSERGVAMLFKELNFNDIPLARDEIKAFLVDMVDTYGSALAEGAVDWYQSVRPEDLRPYDPEIIKALDVPERMDRTSRYAVDLLQRDPAGAVKVVARALGREIQSPARRTLLKAADLDPSTPRFARVPRGKTCAFCTLLASRGWVYHSEDLAGGAGHEFHERCDCRIVPDWEHKPLSGYDPDKMYSMYLKARRRAVKSGAKHPDPGIIAAYMRSEYPDSFTDGLGVPRSKKGVRSSELGGLINRLEKENSNAQEG